MIIVIICELGAIELQRTLAPVSLVCENREIGHIRSHAMHT